jgi:hypothetical protein
MRPLPFLITPDFIYSRLKALAWVTNEGILPTLLQANAGKAIAQILINEENSKKPLILDCRGILDVDDHALETTRSLIRDDQRTLVFLNAEPIQQSLRRELGPYSLIWPSNSPVQVFGNYDQTYIAKLIEQSALEVQDYLTTCVKGSFKKFENGDQRMASTPLLASGVFDARNIISDPTKFVWVSLAMSYALEDFLDKGTALRPFRLLAVSLRGSPFAVAVGLLSDRTDSIEIVDHMGPKYKVLEEPNLRSSVVDEDYIYVGDFVVGGTELRIAEAYARTKGSRIKHAVVIGGMLASSDYGLEFEVSSLVNLRECCPTEKFVFLEN